MYLHCLRYIIDWNHYLSGTVPSELGRLTDLKQIWLRKYGRRLNLCWEEHGWNPSSTSNFAFFPLLHDALILAANDLSGSIPSELGLLTNVWIFSLCKYSRRVDLCWEEHGLNPSSISNFAFFPLLHDALILADNQLSGSIPSELGRLKNVERIHLCKYGRRVDLCLEEHGWNPSSTSNFAFFPLLHDALILGNNQLSGSIPSELFALPNLRTVSESFDLGKGIRVGKWIW